MSVQVMEMASASGSGEESAEAGGWWGSWISSAKSKSAEVFTMVKKDLDEIGSAVRSEASHVYSTTSSVIGKTLKLDEPESTANVMKKSFSTFIDQVNTVLNPEPDDEDTEVILSTGDTTMLSTYKKEIEALQRVDATFIVPAEGGEFEAWRGSVEGEGGAGAAARRLRGEPLLSAQYERLVPDAVSHDDFWERYLFRVALLQDRLAAAARRRRSSGAAPAAEQPCADPVLAHLPLLEEEPITRSPEKTPSPLEPPPVDPSVEVDEGVAWDDEDFASDVELTEEQQILLLQEYEREIASKKQNKNGSVKDAANNNTKTSPNKVKSKVDSELTKPVDNKPQRVKAIDNKAKPIDKAKSAEKPKTIDKAKSPEKTKTIDNTKDRTVDNRNSLDSKNMNDKAKIANKADAKTNKTENESDVCGNNLVEDHFDDKEIRKVKDDASSNSDESWEKEFEIEERTA